MGPYIAGNVACSVVWNIGTFTLCLKKTTLMYSWANCEPVWDVNLCGCKEPCRLIRWESIPSRKKQFWRGGNYMPACSGVLPNDCLHPSAALFACPVCAVDKCNCCGEGWQEALLTAAARLVGRAHVASLAWLADERTVDARVTVQTRTACIQSTHRVHQ